MHEKLNKPRLVITIIFMFLIILLICLAIFFYMLSPVNKIKKDKKYEVLTGSSINEIIEDLDKKGYIRSTFYTKIYLKFKKNISFKAGTYTLNDKYSTIKIIEVLSSDKYTSDDTIMITFKEGFSVNEFINTISTNFNITPEEIENKLKDKEYLNKLIKNYWFITEEILNENIRYSLEGYLFPNTYSFYKDSSIEDILKILLDETDKVLTKYKSDIKKSNYSVHKILTMASIIEKEAILDDDRSLVSSVFYNRLKEEMKFQSCATLGYAIKEWKLSYTDEDMKENSLYNTYKYLGFPPGPISNAGEKSVLAAIKPTESDYLYFMADVCSSNPKTYFSRTYEEHTKKVNKYLNCN